MPSYEQMMEYVLDAGRECECCVCRGFCHGIVLGPDGPVFPPCSDHDFGELLDNKLVEQIYQEDHVDA